MTPFDQALMDEARERPEDENFTVAMEARAEAIRREMHYHTRSGRLLAGLVLACALVSFIALSDGPMAGFLVAFAMGLLFVCRRDVQARKREAMMLEMEAQRRRQFVLGQDGHRRHP